LRELPDVAGKTLLHLQCHFGIDTLSWAMLGAEVTGADFSECSIALARSLSERMGIPARFVCSDLYALPGALDEQFDVVFTSYGVLPWLPDIGKWAEVVAHFVKPGGVFYIVEFHPLSELLTFDEKTTAPMLAGSYFESGPHEYKTAGSYADPTAHVEQGVEYEWRHSIGEVVTSLVEAGLQIQFLHEFPCAPHTGSPHLMQRREDGLWWFKDRRLEVPLTFSIKATKAA
jgi:ubiquinone/menaquinone biosynthesis C-methylase UbiE